MSTHDPGLKRMMRNSAILLTAFLLGLIPVLVRNLQLKSELADARAALALSQTRGLASLAYLETSRNNFGLAAEHASRLYQRLDELARSGEEPVASVARDALSRRHAVMGMLANADGNAQQELRNLTSELYSRELSETQTRARTP